jgi:hypothetical protein
MNPLQVLSVEQGDVMNFPCDVLVLKHAQGFYGADGAVASRLAVVEPGLLGLSLPPDKYRLLSSQGTLSAERVLFMGVVQLYRFDYGQIRSFARYALRVLHKEQPHARTIAMTMHGIGYGLDEQEAFLAQVAGVQDAFDAGTVPGGLKKIIFVERNKGRAARLKEILAERFSAPPAPIEAGTDSGEKPHVFVAMPFSDALEDVYGFGIQGPVNAAGYLCERVDMAHFTGDILERIKTRIETAALVIADLTGANANVYLEVGYAWGKGRPTLLALNGDPTDLMFDVKGHRCLFYKNISDLCKKLTAELPLIIPPVKPGEAE